MTKYRYDKDQDAMVEILEDGTTKPCPKHTKAPEVRTSGLMRDIQEFQSPITGKMVTSRSELREHNKVNGVEQIGNDWVGKKPEYVERRQDGERIR